MIRSKLLGLDDELVNSLPGVVDVTNAMGRDVDAGMGDALAAPTPIDPWADAPGIAPSSHTPATPTATQGSSLASIGRDFAGIATPFVRMADRSAAATSPTGMHFVHDPIRSSPPTLDHPIPLGDTADDPWTDPTEYATAQGTQRAIEPLAGLGDDAQPAEVQASNKGLPGLSGFDPFGTTADESKALERAQRFDRRAGIARGVMQLVGGLGGVVGAASGIPAIGAAGQGISAAGTAPFASLTDTVNGRIRERQAGDFRRLQYGQQQEDRAAQREDRDLDRAVRERAAASNMEVDRARVAQLETATRQAQNEIDAAGADSAAARNILAHFAAGLNDDSPAADQLRAAIADPSFAGMSSQTARETMARYAQLANRRGAGLIDNGGGGGNTSTVFNPATGQWETTGGGGPRHRASPAPAATPGGDAAPVPAPGRGRGRGASGGGPAQPAPAPAEGTAPQSEFDQLPADVQNALRQAGAEDVSDRLIRYAHLQHINLLHPDGVRWLLGQREIMQRGRGPAYEELTRDLDATFGQSAADVDVTPSYIQQRELQAVAPRLNQSWNDMHYGETSRLIRQLNAAKAAGFSNLDYQRLTYALRHPEDDAAQLSAHRVEDQYNMSGFVGDLSTLRDSFGRVRSGGAITREEWLGLSQMLNTGTIGNDVNQLLNSLNRFRSDAHDLFETRVRTSFADARAGDWILGRFHNRGRVGGAH